MQLKQRYLFQLYPWVSVQSLSRPTDHPAALTHIEESPDRLNPGGNLRVHDLISDVDSLLLLLNEEGEISPLDGWLKLIGNEGDDSKLDPYVRHSEDNPQVRKLQARFKAAWEVLAATLASYPADNVVAGRIKRPVFDDSKVSETLGQFLTLEAPEPCGPYSDLDPLTIAILLVVFNTSSSHVVFTREEARLLLYSVMDALGAPEGDERVKRASRAIDTAWPILRACYQE